MPTSENKLAKIGRRAAFLVVGSYSLADRFERPGKIGLYLMYYLRDAEVQVQASTLSKVEYWRIMNET